jgi:hypothetical protein
MAESSRTLVGDETLTAIPADPVLVHNHVRSKRENGQDRALGEGGFQARSPR